MANIQALEQLKRNTAALETVRDVREFIALDRGENPVHRITLEVPGGAIAGHSEYRAMLTEHFNELLPLLNKKILGRLFQREEDAKASIADASERL